MNIRTATEEDRSRWEAFVDTHPAGNFRQTFSWGRIRELAGWQPLPVMVEHAGAIRAAMLILKKPLPLGRSLFYACRGPVLDWQDGEAVSALAAWLPSLAREHSAVLLRVDPEPVDVHSMRGSLSRNGFVPVHEPFTAWNRTRYEIRLPLERGQSDEELLRTFRRTHRQDINKAARKGVEIHAGLEEGDERVFFDLMSQLESNRYAIAHDYDYYARTVREVVRDGRGELLKAVYDGKVVAVLLLAFVGDRCWAVYQANDYEYRRLMPNKLVLWEGIRLAKARGSVFFDMGASQGVSFDRASALDGYKMAYRPEVVEFPEYYDLPFNPLLYRLFVLSEFKVVPMVYRWKHSGFPVFGSRRAKAV